MMPMIAYGIVLTHNKTIWNQIITDVACIDLKKTIFKNSWKRLSAVNIYRNDKTEKKTIPNRSSNPSKFIIICYSSKTWQKCQFVWLLKKLFSLVERDDREGNECQENSTKPFVLLVEMERRWKKLVSRAWAVTKMKIQYWLKCEWILVKQASSGMRNESDGKTKSHCYLLMGFIRSIYILILLGVRQCFFLLPLENQLLVVECKLMHL